MAFQLKHENLTQTLEERILLIQEGTMMMRPHKVGKQISRVIKVRQVNMLLYNTIQVV